MAAPASESGGAANPIHPTRHKHVEDAKGVDAVIIEIENMYLSGAIGFDTVKKLEQALKGINTMNIAKKAEGPSQKVQA
ncbi:hypothetical protein FDB76_20465 (plasmid) [Acinetobacter baumannii]|nr:hypothetical protein FDB76_20465 [Acinetobacter baumannii]